MIPTIFIGRIRGTDVRFFPPQTDDDLLPWVAVDELIQAMSLTADQQRAAESVTKRGAKRIGTPKGMASVMSAMAAAGVIHGLVKIGYSPASIEDDYSRQLFEAARERLIPLTQVALYVVF